MSRVGVIVALVVALVLAGAAVLLTAGRGRASAPAGPLLNFDPARLVEITVERPGGVTETARRIGGGSWVIEFGGGAPWPAAGERVRPAIRILSTLEPMRPAERGAELPGGVATVRLGLEDGSARVMRISSRALAGAVLVEVRGDPPRKAWVDAALSDMLIGTGMGAWRQTTAMGDLGMEVARVRVQSARATLSLARVQGRWAITDPVSGPAEPDAVARLFSLISQTRVRDFLDGGPPAATGLDTPVASLTVESDQRDESGTIATEVRRLEVGTTADVAGRTVYARLSGERQQRGGKTEFWSRIVILDGQPLAEINTDAAAYVSRKALRFPASEVGRINVGDASPAGAIVARFERTLDGWRRVGEAGPAPLAAGEAKLIPKLLDLLTEVPAAKVQLQEPEGFTPIGTLRLLSLGDGVLGLPDVGTTQDGKVVAAEGLVWRVYPPEAAGEIATWLSGLTMQNR